MTSIICWKNSNKEEWYPGVWAVADSRVSSGAGTMTDNLQKLFVLPVRFYRDEFKVTREYSQTILNVCYGFAGSTLIGTSVKDILALCLDNLSEIAFYDGDGGVEKTIEERTPSLEEVARLAQKIAQKYLLSVGQCYPQSARCEIVIFGFCKVMQDTRVFVLKNSPDDPARIGFEERDVSGGEYVVLGDRKEEVLSEVRRKSEACCHDPYWNGRAPILALQQIIKNSSISSIGGEAQICMATRFTSRTMYVSDVQGHKFPLLGFDMFTELGTIGGFSISIDHSLNVDKRFIF